MNVEDKASLYDATEHVPVLVSQLSGILAAFGHPDVNS
jgi:hypothetical protein